MTRLFRTLAAGSMLALAFSTTAPAYALDAQQKKEMGEVIREYLLQNPEIMLEVQDALQAKQASQRNEMSTKGIADNSKEIFSSPTDITLGNPKGDVTVVEFFDYNCGYCKHAMADMDGILKKDKNVRFVLKEFPILGPNSVAAHKVANAVRLVAPEKYPEFHRTLLGGTAQATEASAMAVAKSLGVSEAAIRKSMADSPNDALVKQAYDLANAIGITGTPTYVVGNEAIFGAQGLDAIEQKVTNVRTCGKATC